MKGMDTIRSMAGDGTLYMQFETGNEIKIATASKTTGNIYTTVPVYDNEWDDEPQIVAFSYESLDKVLKAYSQSYRTDLDSVTFSIDGKNSVNMVVHQVSKDTNSDYERDTRMSFSQKPVSNTVSVYMEEQETEFEVPAIILASYLNTLAGKLTASGTGSMIIFYPDYVAVAAKPFALGMKSVFTAKVKEALDSVGISVKNAVTMKELIPSDPEAVVRLGKMKGIVMLKVNGTQAMFRHQVVKLSPLKRVFEKADVSYTIDRLFLVDVLNEAQLAEDMNGGSTILHFTEDALVVNSQEEETRLPAVVDGTPSDEVLSMDIKIAAPKEFLNSLLGDNNLLDPEGVFRPEVTLELHLVKNRVQIKLTDPKGAWLSFGVMTPVMK